MKKLIFVMICAMLAYNLQADDQPIAAKSKIKSATVFLSGAQVSNYAEVQIPKGSSTIIFEDFTSNINPQSIQVKGQGAFSILSVTHQLNYLRSKQMTAEIKGMQDSIELLQRDIDYQNAILSVYNDEEQLVLVNKELAGSNTGVKASDIRDAADFFRVRLTEIRTQKLLIAAKIKKLVDRRTIISNQLNTLSSSQNDPTSEIVVVVNTDVVLTGKFTIKYMVYNAGWTPSYDLRAIDVNNPIELVYKANVWQTTGKDWDKVMLTLSTGNPTQSGSRPVLSTWYLSFINNYGYYKQDTRKSGAGEGNAPTSANGVAGFEVLEETKTGADYTVVNENQTNIEFEISVPYTIPSDGKYKIVEIQKYSLPAQYEYYAAPKLDRDAFLMARITGWDQYNLLAGESNLFFDGTYLGKSYINPRYTLDTLDISLGRDGNISVTREKLKDFSHTKVIGTNKKETFTFEINIRNKKKSSISMVLEDQIPVSTDKEIEVEQIEISGAEIDENTGKLKWKFDLKPSETKTIRISYSVKYPKDKSINL